LAEQKKVLVLESETLLATGIFNILVSRPELHVAKTTARSLTCLHLTGSHQPDVIIMEEELLADNLAAVIRLTNDLRHLRLIVFNLIDANVHIFDKHTVQVESVGDFAGLL
jgi:chemotaxis response regulator CheB